MILTVDSDEDLSSAGSGFDFWKRLLQGAFSVLVGGAIVVLPCE